MESQPDNLIPAWLETPPLTSVKPPVATRAQELPFVELTWESFEKLCFRLARLESDVKHCQLYGTRGQDQKGIDLYARQKHTGVYSVYQCKREKKFGPAKITEAVDKFLAGEWADRAKKFVLCTTESLASTERAEEFEKQQALLGSKDIEFIAWSSDQLSLKLKDLPEIVDDFFSREWVRIFCGEDQVSRLGKRLDVHAIVEFRAKVANFYHRVFNEHDPGLPLMSSADAGNALPFDERYVLPDIEDRQIITFSGESNPSGESPETQSFGSESPLDNSVTPLTEQRRQKPPSSQSGTSYQQRHRLEHWLAQAERHVILGGAGSGKSSLLRFIALDILRDSPHLPALAQKWGRHLPVWIPFALWTKKISDPATNHLSLSDLLREWLHSWDEDDLWPLVERALEDQRLLLLVDGLDEWSNEEAAGIALQRLRVFIEGRDLPAIITGRPHGFSRLGMPTAGWRIGNLAGLSAQQQKSLAHLWFSHRMRVLTRSSGLSEDECSRRTEAETDEFISELRASADLQDLAATPLLLILLIAHRVYKVHLPQSRFKAYRSLIEHLLSTHPSNRRKASSLPINSTTLSEEDMRRILAHLAFRLQEEHPEGMIDEVEARSIVEGALRDSEQFGFNLPDARRLAREAVDVGENVTGLLVKRSQTEIAFYHRAFQEYLAGIHLFSMSSDDRLRIVRERCADSQWREVILALFSEIGRPDDIKQFVEQILAKDVNYIEHDVVLSLLAETAFGFFNCSVGLAIKLANEVFKEIELGNRISKREDLLRHAISGLRSSKVRDVVQEKLKSWFPRRGWWRQADLFAEMAKWPRLPEVIECLVRGMHDEQVSAQRQAARSLADLAGGDDKVGERMASLACRAIDPSVRAAALEGFLRGWPEHDELPALATFARSSSSPQLRLIGILGKIKLQIQNNDDFKDLLHLGGLYGGLDYWWRDLVVEALINGWPQVEELKEECLKSLRRTRLQKTLDDEIAVKVLLKGFQNDDEVAELFASSFEQNRGPGFTPPVFLHLGNEGWSLLAENFRDHPLLVKAIDELLLRTSDFHWEVNIYGALIGRTAIAKTKLLSHINSGSVSRLYIKALLDGWGMDDAEVAEVLRQIAFGQPNEYAAIADFLPRIIQDKKACREQLMKLYTGRELDGRARCILAGLGDPEEAECNANPVELVIDYALRQEDSEYGFYMLREIASLYPSDPRVREIGKREALRPNGNYPLVASFYGHDDEIRKLLIDIACPLPVPLRKLIASQLSSGAGDDAFALSLLRDYDQDDNDEVTTQASIAYHTILKTLGIPTAAALEKLSHDIVRSGPDYAARRQAALAGLITLSRLELITTIEEPATHLVDKHCCVPVVTRPYPNVPLQNLLLKNWSYLKRCLGDDRWKYLTSDFRADDRADFWDSYCPLASEYPEAREEALAFLADTSIITANILRFIAQTMPKSEPLLENCLRALNPLKSDWMVDAEATDTASELLGAHFGGDPHVLQRLLAIHRSPTVQGNSFDERLIAALCEGWPDSKELEQIVSAAKEFKPRLSHRTYLQLVCRKSDSRFVFERLLDLIRSGEFGSYVGRLPVAKPVIRRLQTDDDLAKLLTSHLTGDPSASDKATIPRLLAAVRGVPPELRQWCIQESAAQLEEGTSPEMGFDLVSREVRPVVHSLFDVLAAGQ
jgi:NACHT domain-containing protein/restriction endonuclease